MPASGPRSRGARNHPRPCQGNQPWPRTSAAPGLVLATQMLDGTAVRGTKLSAPGIRYGAGASDGRKRERDRSRPRRLGAGRSARGARRRRARGRRARRCSACRTRPFGTWPGGCPGTWPLGRARQRGDAAVRARSPRAALLAAPAADVHPLARARAARRRLGGGHGRDRRGARPRVRARGVARLAAVRAGRRGAAALPRGRGGRLELPRHAAPGRVRALRGRRRATRGARAAHAAHDRERLRADRPDRARRLGDSRGAPRGDPRRPARPRAAVRPAGGGDGARSRHCKPAPPLYRAPSSLRS